jgi:hypothetical protein
MLAMALLFPCDGWLVGDIRIDEMGRGFVRTWHALLPFAGASFTPQLEVSFVGIWLALSQVCAGMSQI